MHCAFRVALAVVALTAYIDRYRPPAAVTCQVIRDGGEYFVLFNFKPSTFLDTAQFCANLGGRLPVVKDNRRRQDATHALLQLYSRHDNDDDDAYVWTDHSCRYPECPPLDADSWLYGNYETQSPVVRKNRAAASTIELRFRQKYFLIYIEMN